MPRQERPLTTKKGPSTRPGSAVTALLAEARALQAELHGYEQEREELREQSKKATSRPLQVQQFQDAARHRKREILQISTRARRVLRQLCTELDGLGYVDDLRLELNGVQDRYIDLIANESVLSWISSFLEELIQVLQMASETAVELASAPVKKGGRPVSTVAIHGEMVRDLRGGIKQQAFADLL